MRKMPKLNKEHYIQEVSNYLKNLQDNICNTLESNCKNKTDTFIKDSWISNLGVGESRLIEKGDIIERGGVNFSKVSGKKLPSSALSGRGAQNISDCEFNAMGVSIVIHPKNPFAPTTHFNLRFFIIHKDNIIKKWWFGGGYDLTPYFYFKEDAKHWQQTAKSVCDKFDLNYYPKFKKDCDDYFYLPHRKEPRGIGGLFFDNFNYQNNFNLSFDFAKSIGDSFIYAYNPILEKRKHLKYNKKQREFQKYRRGRYVEFNLLYDRGTLFGLQSKGRTESILMSMPPEVSWQYANNMSIELKQYEEDLLKNFLL
jgi:coproporphyrinogen III oxidase